MFMSRPMMRPRSVPSIIFLVAFQILVLALTNPSTRVLVKGIDHEYDDHNDLVFRQKVDAALTKVHSLLESAKSPRRVLSASDVNHGYQDKFSLAEFIPIQPLRLLQMYGIVSVLLPPYWSSSSKSYTPIR